jgi:uncharacterized protein YjaG (DUF416 family)
MFLYDEVALREKLTEISSTIRPAFAAACAERLYLPFERYCIASESKKDAEMFRSALDSIWNHLRDAQTDRLELERVGRWAENVGPNDESDWTELNPYAENAAASLFYAIRACLSDDPQDCVWAARQAYEAVDYYTHNAEDIDFNQQGAEARILAHPIVQRELRHQFEDISQLTGITPHERKMVIQAVQTRSRLEPILPFDILSAISI